MEGRRPAPLIGDLDGDIHIRDRHLYEDGQLRPVIVAVLAGDAEVCQGPPGAASGCRHSSSDLSRVTRVMSSSCSQSSPVKRVSSERRKPISVEPPVRWVPTSPCNLGKPNISRCGSCASTSPSL